MRLNFIIFFLLFFASASNAQKLTGIWRGYFSSSTGLYRDQNGEPHQETYKYEVQIDQQSNNSVKGVTYSYKTQVFYGKAALNGIYTASSKSLIIKETKLVELKIADRSEPCLMTCYLDYTRIGKLEVLEGTFISINTKDKGDCGSGKIYLERVPNSDFKKEDFLTDKKEKPAKELPSLKLPPVSAPAHPVPVPDKTDNAKTGSNRPAVHPPATGNTAKANPPSKPAVPKANPSRSKPVTPPAQNPVVVNRPAEQTQEQPAILPKADASPVSQEQIRKMPLPKVLTERENHLVKTITTSEEDIQVDIYDNGTIDNDTITLYHNNQMVMSHARLTYTALTLKIKNSATDNHHELVIVAENLGEIPPNTALMVITAPGNRKERYEITLASTEQRNAKVVINYVPKVK